MRLLIVLLALSACSRTVKEASSLDRREVAKLASAEVEKKSETLETATREVKQTGPVTTVIEEFGPGPETAEPALQSFSAPQAPRVEAHKSPRVVPILTRRTTITQGPVEDVKDSTSKAKIDTSDKTKIAAEQQTDTHAKKASEKDTEVGPPRWMIGLAICFVVLVATIVGVIYLRWIGKKATAVANIVLPKDPP